MAPLADAAPDMVTPFEDLEVDPAFDEVRRCGQADRAGSDDRDRQGVEPALAQARDGEIDQGHDRLGLLGIDELRY